MIPKPFFITALASLFVAALLAAKPFLTDGQQGIPIGAAQVHVVNGQKCTNLDSGTGECLSDYFDDKEPAKEFQVTDNDDEEDPMLEEMPGLGFKAYKRADISSFYREPPGSRVEVEPSFKGQAGKFVNMSPERLDLYWDAGQGPPGRFMGQCGPFESRGTSTFPGHVFFFIRPKTKEVVCSFRMAKGTSVYYCDPFIKSNPDDPSAGVLSEPVLSLDKLTEQERKHYDSAVFNRNFAPLYKNFTGGSEWLGNFPTEHPKHHIWRADYFGQEHHIETKETHFIEMPPADVLGDLSVEGMRNNEATLGEYRVPGTMNITIKAVSVAPRIFQIDNFLSDVEVDHLFDIINRHELTRSTVGAGGKDSRKDTTRTSKNTWIKRSESPIMDAIYRRGADVLKIDEALMRERMPDETFDRPSNRAINEDLQVVHYNKGQQYTAHHDFVYPDTRANAPSRSINLCMYLNEGMEGGETAFPRWRNAHTSDGIEAVPKRGKAMIFYMRNPDGNLEDLSQHAAMPVIEGEKWFANLWTWDPVRT